MSTWRFLTSLSALLLACAQMGTLGAQNRPEPAASRLLEIQAAAVDGSGIPVTDLKPSEFEVWIGGYRVPVESVGIVGPSSAGRNGRLITLLLDDITLDPVMVTRAREAAQRFAERMQPGDRIGVMRLNGGRTELSPEPARVRQNIGAFRQSLGMLPVSDLGVQLLAQIATAARVITEEPEARKTIVAIGSGWLLDTPVLPGQSGRNLRNEWFDAVGALSRAGATYYVIDPHGLAGRTTGTKGLAYETGGHAFVNTNDMDGAVDRILREMDNYYVLSVGDPPVGRKAVLREMDVRVLRRGVAVRAPRSVPGGRLQ